MAATDLRAPSADDFGREFSCALSTDREVVDACAGLLTRSREPGR